MFLQHVSISLISIEIMSYFLWASGRGGIKGVVENQLPAKEGFFFWCFGQADAGGLPHTFHVAPGGFLAVGSHGTPPPRRMDKGKSEVSGPHGSQR